MSWLLRHPAIPEHLSRGCRTTCCSVRWVGTHASLTSRVRAGALPPWADTNMGRRRTCTADVRVATNSANLNVALLPSRIVVPRLYGTCPDAPGQRPPLVCGPVVTALPKYSGEPRR